MSEACVGCGAMVEVIDGPVHRYMTAAPACWARYGELLAPLSAEPGNQPARIMCVDSYAAQHPGTPNPQAIQSVAVHLLNIYSYVIMGRPVGLPRVGMKHAFHWMEPPSFASARTVFDMPLKASREEFTRAAKAWAESVWIAWAPHHGQIVSWYSQLSQRK